MRSDVFRIPRISDVAIAKVFEDIAEKYGIKQLNVNVAGVEDFGAVQLATEPSPMWAALLKHDAYLIKSLSLAMSGISVTYNRGGADQKSPIFDEIQISIHQSSPPNKEVGLELAAYISKHRKLNVFSPGRVIQGTVSEEAKQLEAIHQDTLERLERLNEKLINDTNEYRNQLDIQLDQRVAANADSVAAQKRKLDEDHAVRASKLDEERKELEAKLKEIDDRDNTHVRRAIRDKMLDDVKGRIEDFGVSKQTANKRVPVLLGILSLICVIGFFLILSVLALDAYHAQLNAEVISAATGKAVKPNIDELYKYMLWGRIAVLSLGLIASILYYIKWQSRWAEHHAHSEFQLQQFYIDVNRANWIIESGLEWQKVTQTPMPDQLLASVTKNLFSSQTEPDTVLHPADELASALVGSASKLNLKVGDSEIVFDKPSKIPKAVRTGPESS